MGPPRIVPLIVALALVAATISSASARDGHAIGGSVNPEVVPGGDSTVTTAEAEKAQGDIDIILHAKADSDTAMFEIMAFTMMQVRAPKRTAACLMIASSVGHDEDWRSSSVFAERDIEGTA